MSDDSGLDLATMTRPKTRAKRQTRRIPPYNVILLNDDYHTPEFVIEVLFRVFGYPIEKCCDLMLTAHNTGRSVIWTGSKEVAEFKVEQFLTFHEKREDGDLG